MHDWTGLDHLHCWRSMTWLNDTIVLHSSRSCAILVHSATDDPIQSLMSSVHRLLGLDDLVVSYHWSSHEGPLCTGCPLSPCAQKTAISVVGCPSEVAFFSNFFQNGLVCSVLFPADPQDASIWRHFKGANPFPVIGLQGPCLAPICSHCPYQQSHQTSFQIWIGQGPKITKVGHVTRSQLPLSNFAFFQ